MKPKYLIYLESIIDDLFVRTDSSYFDKQEAVTRFIAYLNHPNDLAATTLAAAVYDGIFKSLYVIESNGRASRPVFDQMKYHHTVSLALRGVYGNDFIGTDLMSFDDAVREKFFAADLVQFLLSYGLVEEPYKHGPSIKKAHFYFQKSPEPKRNWDYSWKRFNELWVKYKKTAHFLYSDIHEHNGMFDIKINDKELLSKIDYLANNPNEIATFFQRSKYIFDQLTSMLDRRATKLLRFPKLPKGWAPIEVKMPELSPDATELMGYYTSTHDIR